MANVTLLTPVDLFTDEDTDLEDLFVQQVLPAQVVVPFEGSDEVFIFNGTGFTSQLEDGDLEVTGGTITGFEYRENGLTTDVEVTGLSLDVEDVAKPLEKNKFDKFVGLLLEGDDTITGSDGDDGFLGGDGDDTFTGGLGNDVYDAGKGKMDFVVFNGPQADYTVVFDKKEVRVTDNNADNGDEGTDTIINAEYLQFSDGMVNLKDLRKEQKKQGSNDDGGTINGTENGEELIGTAGDDVINGLGGDDDISGGDGKDELIGGEGNDELDGGEGKDELIGGAGNDIYTIGKGDKVVENANEGDDTIISDTSVKLGDNVENVSLIDNSEKLKVRGNDLDNNVSGNDGDNRIDGRDGNDTLDGLGGDDRIKGGDGDDEILGFFGSDRLDGGDGDDMLFGEDDDDQLRGGDGDDRLNGGDGDDELIGGDGIDTFDFNAVSSTDVDVLTDFELEEDIIDVATLGITSLGQFQAGASTEGKDTIFTAGNGAQLRIEDVELNELTANNFIFENEPIAILV